MGHRVGIDLGTTNSLIAFNERGTQRAVRLEGDDIPMAVFPSCVGLGEDGELLYGNAARMAPQSIREFKRHIGTDATWELGGDTYNAVQLSALVLAEMRSRFEKRHGPIESAVITVPANFDDRQRHETREAGKLAGLEVSRIINEPSAAAIAYSLSDQAPAENALVIDWGGGTLDVSLIDCIEDVLDVRSNDGDRTLGGKDIDAEIMALVEEKLGRRLGAALDDPAVRAELAMKCEAIKIHLSTNDAWEDPIDLRTKRMFLDFSITRKELEARIEPLIDRVLRATRRCLDKAPEGSIDPLSVSDVILVGGSCRVPLLQRRVREFFGQSGRMDLNHLEVVVLGAAYQAEHAAGGGDLVTLHSLATSLGVACTGIDKQGVKRKNLFKAILPATSKLPARATHQFFTVHDDQTDVLISVYETESDSVEDLRPWDTRLITGLPQAPAGAFPIHVTFDYGIEQMLRVLVEIKEAGIREEWKATFREELEEQRPSSEAMVSRVRSPSIEALVGFRDRVRASLDEGAMSEELEGLLGKLDHAIQTDDVPAGMSAKRDLGVALFDQGFSLK